jgi:hypothetical protein
VQSIFTQDRKGCKRVHEDFAAVGPAVTQMPAKPLFDILRDLIERATSVMPAASKALDKLLPADSL